MSGPRNHRWRNKALLVTGETALDAYFSSDEHGIVMVSIEVFESILRDAGWVPADESAWFRPEWKQLLTGNW